MEISKTEIGNALTSSDENHILATANDIYDETQEAYQSEINQSLAEGKQDKLVSGENIKTINGTSLLGSGDVVIVGGGTDKHGAAYPNGKTDKPYHKVASVSSAVNAILDTNISFYVSEYYNDTSCGILNISLRWKANSDKFQFNRIFWSLNVGIDVNDFILGWSIEDSVVTCNLYVKRTGWTSYALKRIDEQAWGNPNDLWQCYNATYPNNCYEAIPDANTVVSVNETISVNSAITANKLSTARAISLSGSVVGSTTFDGSKNATINSKLDWGGKYAQASDPIEALALQGQMNVFSFIKPESVTVEYHNGDGVWLDYGLTNEDITNLFTPTIGKSQIYAGKESNLAANATTRIIIDFYQAEVYARIKEILIKFVLAPTSNDYYYTKFSVERYEDYMTDTWISSEDTRMYNTGYLSYSVNIFGSTNPAYGYEGTGGYARLKIEYYRKEATTRNTYLSSIVAISNEIINAPNPMSKTALPCTLDWKQNAKFPANVTATKHITQGGTANQVTLGNGTLKDISELSPITDADADILLDNHIHSIDVKASGEDVNINITESTKNGNAWETTEKSVTIPVATQDAAGVISAADKKKINSINYKDNTIFVGDGMNGTLSIGYESSKASADMRVQRDMYATTHVTSYNDTTGGSIAVMESNGGKGAVEVNGDQLAELVLSGAGQVRATLTKENEDGTNIETIIDAAEGITAPKLATIGGTSEQILLGDGTLITFDELKAKLGLI